MGETIPHTQEKDIPGNANWVIQKYGGTSLGKFPVNIAEDIIVYVKVHPKKRDHETDIDSPGLKQHRIAVVCSARSTYTKSEGTTNRYVEGRNMTHRSSN